MKKILLFLFLVGRVLADTIAVNNAAFVAGLSPFNWRKNGATYVQAVNPGAYSKVNFSGTSIGITVDVSAMSGASTPAINYPFISWQVDGGATSTRQLLSTDTTITLASSLSNTTHSLRLNFLASDAYPTYTYRWNGGTSLKITALVVDTGKTLSAATLQPNGKALFFGDSITEGAWLLGGPNSPTYNLYSTYESSTQSYAALLGAYFQVEYGQCAFGGEGWDSDFFGDIPPFPSAWPYIYSGVSRDFSGCNLVVINIGQNGGVAASSTVTTFLTQLRSALSAAGSAAQINIMVPFNGNTGGTGRTNITAGYNAYIAANPSDTRTYLVDLGSPGETISTNNSWDGVHLNATGNSLEAGLLQTALHYQYGVVMTGLTATTMNVGP